MSSEYAHDALSHYRSVEMNTAPSSHYMTRQNDINQTMREILIDWCVDVQLKLKMGQETLFLAIHIIDRFLDCRLVHRSKLQLVGCTSLVLASKYEDVYSPEVNDFVYISDKACTRGQIIAMEECILCAIGYNVSVPLPIDFLRYFSRIVGIAEGTDAWFLSAYYTELTLQSYVFLRFLPSQIAGAAIYLAQTTAMCSPRVWSTEVQQQLNYTPSQLSECIIALYDIIKIRQSGTLKYKAVQKKYTHPVFHCVANMTCLKPEVSSTRACVCVID